MAMLGDRKNEITWAQFEVCNANPQSAFENMCRWLFNEFFFNGKELLHSEPNNPGIEVLPVYHEDSKKRISFQAKFFGEMDYEQIKHSAQTAVNHYAGALDVIYLYCNKDVTTTSKAYQAVVSILNDDGIQIIPITNQEILTQVMKNETIAWRYFDYFDFTEEWLSDHVQAGLASLGPRYNDKFNVPTETEKQLNFFLCTQDAVDEINRTKAETLERIKRNYSVPEGGKNLRRMLIAAINALPDVTCSDIQDCIRWPDAIKKDCFQEIEAVSNVIRKRKADEAEAERDGDFEKSNKIWSEVRSYTDLIHIPDAIIPQAHSCSLMCNQVLIVRGNAGTGKSHMFGAAAKKLVDSGHKAILLLGTDYLTEQSIIAQTSDVLNVNLSLQAVLHKLEAHAIQNGIFSYIFIDAINESTHKSIWKSGLQQLIRLMKSFRHIKLAVSIRSGYERIVLSDDVNRGLENNKIGNLVHNGFMEKSIEATLTFLNYYGIPFLPSYFLQAEMTNPLFLSLYCKNYTGENFDIYSLFERVISNADKEAMKAAGVDLSFGILHHLIDEMVSVRLKNDSILISKSDLFDLEFWNRYGLSNRKLEYIDSLLRSGFFIVSPHKDMEWYSLGYNLLEDFVCAKSILKWYPQKSELIPYICKELLKIEDGTITCHHNIDITIIVCGLYADLHGEECFEDIETQIIEEFREDIDHRYLNSYLWRKASSVDDGYFLQFIRTHYVRRDNVLRVLIENSTKEHHPLNAHFLHKILLNRTMADRDELWTTFINYLAYDEERIYQLINYFDEGHVLDGMSTGNTELLLILFTWLLTSSNRFLRDKASKAAIELLKRNFGLSAPLLKRFETVNDPYVIQRLYGIVFGACMKRTGSHSTEFKELAEYVYTHIFDQDSVYPDVLLRDYARLIVERWRYEYPEESSCISIERITPPYCSEEIPVVEKQTYIDDEDYSPSGYRRIHSSMQINHAECPGLYGDFGRYIFQSALQSFEGIDIANMYHYAMQFIRDDLGYSESLSEYDIAPHYHRYSRNDTKKVERIGKKYQWIALYNILARVSDRYLVKSWEDEPYPYEGPWEPYVRDFDPTLNIHFLNNPGVPEIKIPAIEALFLGQVTQPTTTDICQWKDDRPVLFDSIGKRMILQDASGQKWVSLFILDIQRREPSNGDDDHFGWPNGTQEVWYQAKASFIKEDDFPAIKDHLDSSKVSFQDFPEGKETYHLFSREYAWSPGYRSIFKEKWQEYEIESGGYRTEIQTRQVPDFDNIHYTQDGKMTIPFVEKSFEVVIPDQVNTVRIIPAFSDFMWECGYDASQKDTTSFYVPCDDLIEYFGLHQKQYSGFFYANDGTLACFDGKLAGIGKRLLMRFDLLEQFLKEKGLVLFWSCVGEKQYFLGGNKQIWSEWSGCFHLEEGKINGELKYRGDVK